MKLISLKVQNIRGIIDLELKPDGKNLVIYGPNGSGKSSVVDAIDFLFTGKISRLEGAGTSGITLPKHGPHILHKASSAVVTAQVELDGAKLPVTISRKMSQPAVLDYPSEVKSQLTEICDVVSRGGIILTRRDILRYITAPAKDRAGEIQELLNLQEIEKIRASLVTANNQIKGVERNSENAIKTAQSSVNTILGGSGYSDASLLESVNEHRRILGGEPLDKAESAHLKKDLANPIQSAGDSTAPNYNLLQKAIASIRQIIKANPPSVFYEADTSLRDKIAELQIDTALLSDLQQLELRKHAQEFIDDSTTECPICGSVWQEGHIKAHLAMKIRTAEAAEQAQQEIAKSAEVMSAPARNLRDSIGTICQTSDDKMPTEIGGDVASFRVWLQSLGTLLDSLENPVDTYLNLKFSATEIVGLLAPDVSSVESLNRIEAALTESAPKQTPEQTAWDMLTKLETSVATLEQCIKENEVAVSNSAKSNELLKAYQDARNSVLNGMYDQIKNRFKELYCILHDHEADTFNARLEPDRAGLQFTVDYLGHGLNPPQALHSEGHQDTMGLCLFLALNGELTTPQMGIVVLDDVIMSVDAGHRKDVCRLLKGKFCDRQIIITTHDRTWSQQLKSEGVATGNQVMEITNWNINGGPHIRQQEVEWEIIQADLEQNRIREAAFKLRRGSEDFFESVCDALGAKVTYNSNMRWELGDFLFPAMSRYKELLKEAISAAKSWGREDVVADLDKRESIRNQIYKRVNMEQWAVNTAVHFNNWENMERKDFSPVVDAFKDLHSLFRCLECESILEAIPRKHTTQTVQCSCGKVNWILAKKKKS